MKLIEEDLYKEIIKKIPILCIDIILSNKKGYIVIKRKDSPLKGEWWVPGGRVFIGESSIDAANKAGVKIVVGHNRRFSSGVGEIRRCLQSGKLGQVLHVEAHFSGNSAMNFSHTTWRANRGESPAGALASIGLHMIDTIQYLLGPIERLCCLSKRQVLPVEIDDTTSALFELQSGITGTIGTLFATPSNSLLRIYGTGGLIEAKNEFSEVSFQGDGELYENILIQPSNTLTAEFSSFCDACEGHKAYPVLADEAIRNVAIIEAMSSSSKQMGEWMNISGLLKKGAV